MAELGVRTNKIVLKSFFMRFSGNSVFVEILEIKSAFLKKIDPWYYFEIWHVCSTAEYEAFQVTVWWFSDQIFITIDFHAPLPLSGPSTKYSLRW